MAKIKLSQVVEVDMNHDDERNVWVAYASCQYGEFEESRLTYTQALEALRARLGFWTTADIIEK